MKKIILTLSAALMLTGCNGLFKTEASAMAADSDSIVLNEACSSLRKLKAASPCRGRCLPMRKNS